MDPRGIYTNCIGFAKLCFFASLLNAACRLLGVRRLQKLKFGILILDIQLPDKITEIRVYSKHISCLKEKYCQFFLQSSQYFNEVFWLLLLKRQTLNHPNPPEVTQANASVLLFPSSLCLLSLLYSWHSSGGLCFGAILCGTKGEGFASYWGDAWLFVAQSFPNTLWGAAPGQGEGARRGDVCPGLCETRRLAWEMLSLVFGLCPLLKQS